MNNALHATALRRALDEWRTYRLMAFAALDELHAAQQREARLQEQIAEMRELQRRMARQAFGVVE